jgi:hypothetical protein
MTDANNTAIDAIQIDEDIFSYTVSDEALFRTHISYSCCPGCD